MAHNNNKIARYFISITAALIIIALLLSSFIYSFVALNSDNTSVTLGTSENGTPAVSPGTAQPDSAPFVPEPTTPPPTE